MVRETGRQNASGEVGDREGNGRDERDKKERQKSLKS